MQTRNILILDDNPDDAAMTRSTLEESAPGQFDCKVAHTVEDAQVAILNGTFHAVIADQMLGPSEGSAFLYIVKQLAPQTIQVLCTVSPLSDLPEDAISRVERGEIRYLHKSELQERLLHVLQP